MWKHFNISSKNGHQSHGFIQYIISKNWIAAHWRVSRIEKKVQVTIECPRYEIKISKKVYFCCNLSGFLVSSIFDKNVMNESMALVSNFGTNIEMSLHETKQLPKWRYLVEKNFKIFQKQKFFSIGQINGSKSCFVLCQLLSWSE